MPRPRRDPRRPQPGRRVTSTTTPSADATETHALPIASPTRRGVRALHVAIALLLGAAAAWSLYREIARHPMSELVDALRALPSTRLIAGIGLTIASYVVLTAYDLLALRWLGVPLSYRKTALASFLGYVFSHNVGLSVVGASAARYRIYGSFGLGADKVFRIVAFCAATFWLGLLCLAGLMLVVLPEAIEGGFALGRGGARFAGGGMLACAVAYVVACRLRRRPVRWHKVEFKLPTPRLALLQVAISVADWLLAASVVYALLPPHEGFSFARLVGVYAASQVIACASHVPGGLGVFEACVLWFLDDPASAPATLAALAVYRGLYYLAPLALGSLLLGGFEFGRRVESARERSAG